jgi:hypothetical protein
MVRRRKRVVTQNEHSLGWRIMDIHEGSLTVALGFDGHV